MFKLNKIKKLNIFMIFNLVKIDCVGILNLYFIIRNYMIFCGIAMVFVIGSVTYFAATILSAIHKGFKQATDIANKLTEGDTDIVIENNKKDEFGLLLEDFRRLIEATKKQSHIADAVAEGDLTVDVEVRSDKDTLGLALRKMVDRNLHSLFFE